MISGICRVCACTENTPCLDRDGFPCAWLDEAQTLCDSARCVARVKLDELLAIAGIDRALAAGAGR
jgi:hypothetical protein